MTRGFDMPKASAESVARAIFDGVDKGEEAIFPDPMSQSMAESWRSGAAKALGRQNAAFVEAEPVKAPVSKGRDTVQLQHGQKLVWQLRTDATPASRSAAMTSARAAATAAA